MSDLSKIMSGSPVLKNIPTNLPNQRSQIAALKSHRQKPSEDSNEQGMKSARGQKSHLSGTPKPLNGDEGVRGENDGGIGFVTQTQTEPPLLTEQSRSDKLTLHSAGKR